MADLIKITRGTDAEYSSYLTQVYEDGTVLYNTDHRTIRIADGSTEYQNLPNYTGFSSIKTVSALTYTITDDDFDLYELDGSSNTVTVTLPTASDNLGRSLKFLCIDSSNVVTVNSVTMTSGDLLTFTAHSTGWDRSDYFVNQNVRTTDAVTFATVNTGQGNNECYAMNQNVRTTDSPTFGHNIFLNDAGNNANNPTLRIRRETAGSEPTVGVKLTIGSTGNRILVPLDSSGAEISNSSFLYSESSSIWECDTDLYVIGGVKMGSTDVYTKRKRITSSTPGVGGGKSIAHELTPDKILSVEILVEIATNTFVAPNSGDSTDANYYIWSIGNTNINVNVGSSATGVANKPIDIYITYEV